MKPQPQKNSRRPVVDRIVDRTKAISKDAVIHLLRTESGEHYRVIQLLRRNDYCESIYFVRDGFPQLLRKIYLPLNKVPEPNFEKFIEQGGPFQN
jgi:hypothetical protein